MNARLVSLCLLGTACTTGAVSQASTDAQPEIRMAIDRNHLVAPGMTVLGAKLVCRLTLEKSVYQVIDLVEQVTNQAAPRGYRRAIVFRPDMTVAYALPYTPPARPVSCEGSKLVFSAPVEIDNTLPEGKRVSFSNEAQDAEIVPDR